MDTKLSPKWVDYLGGFGHEAVHWSRVGAHDAEDHEIMNWARMHDHTVLTSDLDFGAILALSSSTKPSVILVRSEATLPAYIGALVLQAIGQAGPELQRGALLTIDAGEPRLRILPLETKH